MAAEALIMLVVEHRLDGLLHVFTCPAVPRFMVRRRAPRTAYGEIRSQLGTAIAELTGFAAEVTPRETAEQFIGRSLRAGPAIMPHEYLVRLAHRTAPARPAIAGAPDHWIRLLRASG
jgi:hypothetical protein